MGIRVILCDDEQESIHKFATLLKECAEKYKIDIETVYFTSGEALICEFEEAGLQADVLYLDIIMNKINGIETAERLRESGCNIKIVFLTSCEDYVYDAFDVNAAQYLVKDNITKEKFEKVFLKVAESVQKKEDEVFICKFGGIKTSIPISQIIYFEISRRLVTVYYRGKSTKFYGNMEDLEQRFKKYNFVRIHRSYLVCLSEIVEFYRSKVILRYGACIPVGGTYYNALCNAFSKYTSKLYMNMKSVGEGI